MNDHRAAISFGATLAAYEQAGWNRDAFLPGIPGEKRPGRWIPDERRWVGMTGSGLLKNGLPSSDPRVTFEEASAYPTPTLCCRGSVVPALDVDSDHEAVQAAVRGLLVGSRYERRRTGSTRFLVPFRAAGPVLRWLPIVFRLPGDDPKAKPHALELNAHGQQWVACGAHPKGSTYRWHVDGAGEQGRDYAPPMGELLPADQGWADDLHSQLVRRLEGLGATFVKDSDKLVKAGADGERLDPDALLPLLGVDTLGRVLAAIPNDPEHVGDWEGAVAILASIRRLLGHDGTVPPDCLEEWIASFKGGTRDDFLDGRWRSFDHGVSAGAGRFMQWVNQHAPAELADEVQREIYRREAEALIEVDDGDMGTPPPGLGLRRVEGVDGVVTADTPIELLRQAYVYRESTGEYVRLADGVIMTPPIFNKTEEALDASDDDLDQQRAEGVERPRRRQASLLAERVLPRVQELTFIPGKPRLFRDYGGTPVLNLWMPPERRLQDAAVSDLAVRPFLDLVEWVLPREEDQATILDWMCHIVQRPGVKVQWAPVLFSETQGVGKDLLLRALEHAVGPHNMATIAPAQLDSEFNEDWVRSQVVYVNELSSYRKRDLVDRLKGLVASTAGDLSVNPKGRARYRVPNGHCWVFTTNKGDALALEAEDRRYAILHAREAKLVDPLLGRVLRFYDWEPGTKRGTRHGLSLVGEWLRARAIGKTFSTSQCPDSSEAKAAMMAATLPTVAAALLERLTSGDWAGRKTLPERELTQLSIDTDARRGDLHKAVKLAGFKAPGKAGADGRVAIKRADGTTVKVKLWSREGPEVVGYSSPRALLELTTEELREYGARADGLLEGLNKLLASAGPRPVVGK